MKKFLIVFALALGLALSGAHASEKVLIYGRVLSITEKGLLISCDPATHSHPTGYYGIAPSKDQIVFVAGQPQALRLIGQAGAIWAKPRPDRDDIVALVALPAGEYAYTTVQGANNTVANFTQAEVVPQSSVVAVVDKFANKTETAVVRGSTQTPDLTLRRGW